MIVKDFDIATDLKVEFYLPDVTGNTFILGISELGSDDVLGGNKSFILGTSLLGGPDLLGDTGFIWQQFETITSEVRADIGGYIQDAIYFQPDPAKTDITLQSYSFDPNVNKNIRTNTKIRIRIDDGLVNHTLFTGYIDTINVSYYVNGPNLIQITAYDIYSQIVNSRLATYDTSALTYITPLQAARKAINQAGYTVAPESVDPGGKIPPTTQTDIQVSGILNEAIEVGLAVTWIDPETESFVMIPRPVSAAGGPTTWTVGNNHGEPYHLCMSDIEVSADADTIFNSLKVTLASDPLIDISLQDFDSIELWGESSYDLTLNVLDATELDRWANLVFQQKGTKLVKRVETPAIDRTGNLTEAATFTPGTQIGVKFTKDQLVINEYYTIVKASHYIDVHNWYTTFELWKES